MWPTPAIIPKLHAYQFVCVYVCVCAYSSDTLLPTHSSLHLHHRPCHDVSVILGWPGDFVNGSYESAMTSRHAYSCSVNKWPWTVTPEAKRDVVKTAIVGFIAHFNHCHFWPDTGCVLIQCLDKKILFVSEMLLLFVAWNSLLTSPVKHLAHCLNRLFTDCLYLNIDSVTESFGGDLFVK